MLYTKLSFLISEFELVCVLKMKSRLIFAIEVKLKFLKFLIPALYSRFASLRVMV